MKCFILLKFCYRQKKYSIKAHLSTPNHIPFIENWIFIFDENIERKEKRKHTLFFQIFVVFFMCCARLFIFIFIVCINNNCFWYTWSRCTYLVLECKQLLIDGEKKANSLKYYILCLNIFDSISDIKMCWASEKIMKSTSYFTSVISKNTMNLIEFFFHLPK